MILKIAKILTVCIYIIIFIKAVFIISTIGHLIFSHYNKNSTMSHNLDKKFSYWQKRTEFIFIILMSILLIFIFTPWHNHKKYITKEMNILFYLFGFILIITADWSLFVTEAEWYKLVKYAIKG
jgi:hypothetical protein